MEASVLHVWRLAFYHNQLLDSCQGAIAKLRWGVGHKYRVREAGVGVRHAATPRNRRQLPYGVSRGGPYVKFKIYPSIDTPDFFHGRGGRIRSPDAPAV